MTLDPEGNPHIGYYVPDRTEVRHAYRVGDTWQTEVVATAQVGLRGLSTAIAPGDKTCVAYYDNLLPGLELACRNPDGSWDTEWVDDKGGLSVSLKFDSQGLAHLSYLGIGGFGNSLYYTVQGKTVSENKVQVMIPFVSR